MTPRQDNVGIMQPGGVSKDSQTGKCVDNASRWGLQWLPDWIMQPGEVSKGRTPNQGNVGSASGITTFPNWERGKGASAHCTSLWVVPHFLILLPSAFQTALVGPFTHSLFNYSIALLFYCSIIHLFNYSIIL